MADDFSDSEGKSTKRVDNQPYDESLDVPDAEEVASNYNTPTPRAASRPRPELGEISGRPSLPKRPGSRMTDQSQDDLYRNKGRKDQDEDDMGESGEDVNESEDDEEDEEDDDDGVHVEGAYDPADYENLPVSTEIKDLFKYIASYTAQTIELETKMRPFIPEYIPAVGDIDAFIKIPRPDNKPDGLGLTVLDEPCTKQSDPSVLNLQLRAFSKQTTAAPESVQAKKVEGASKSAKEIEKWIKEISALHRSQPAPTVHYTKTMPEIDVLMTEWPSEMEELLKQVNVPSASLDCTLSDYVDILCALLDIPVYGPSNNSKSEPRSRIEALHLLFTLFTEFRSSEHFMALADRNELDNALKRGGGASSANHMEF